VKKLSEIKAEYKASLKSMDTEETFDLLFYRPVGYICALISKKLGITPNVITIISIFLGLGAGLMFYYNNIWVNIGGMILLVLADVCDSADGQLARLTKQYSRIGRILDGVSGDIWFAAIYVAICLRENVTSDFFMAHTWLIWVIAVVTGLCHATQAAMADYYRQFHLFFVKGKDGSELEESAAKLWVKFHELSWSKNFFQKLCLMFYTNYTVGQEKRTPNMQRLRRTLIQRFGNEIPQSFRDDFRAKSKPLMKYTNILSFNTRAFAIFIAIVGCRMPWLYFAFELTVLNILLAYMICRHENICKSFIKKIEDRQY
jgi:phosphatidylglycerophosphate synthase